MARQRNKRWIRWKQWRRMTLRGGAVCLGALILGTACLSAETRCVDAKVTVTVREQRKSGTGGEENPHQKLIVSAFYEGLIQGGAYRLEIRLQDAEGNSLQPESEDRKIIVHDFTAGGGRAEDSSSVVTEPDPRTESGQKEREVRGGTVSPGTENRENAGTETVEKGRKPSESVAPEPETSEDPETLRDSESGAVDVTYDAVTGKSSTVGEPDDAYASGILTKEIAVDVRKAAGKPVFVNVRCFADGEVVCEGTQQFSFTLSAKKAGGSTDKNERKENAEKAENNEKSGTHPVEDPASVQTEDGAADRASEDTGTAMTEEKPGDGKNRNGSSTAEAGEAQAIPVEEDDPDEDSTSTESESHGMGPFTGDTGAELVTALFFIMAALMTGACAVGLHILRGGKE